MSKVPSGKGHLLGVAVQQRKLEPELPLEGARRRQLRLGVVDPDRTGAAPGEPGGDIAGAAAELDRVASLELPRKQPDVRLRHPEDPPGRLFRRPVTPPVGDVVRRQVVPVGAVARYVFGEVLHVPSLGRRRHW